MNMHILSSHRLGGGRISANTKPLNIIVCSTSSVRILIVHTNKPFSFGLLNKIVNFGLFLKVASFLATTLHVICSCATDDM